jgi:indolepyruvate ferredoxin oxidoreductase beta subunit
MKQMNIYLCGVGGQGIGLLAGVLAQSCLAAGYRVRGCDTHGLAQRGGTVVSHLRIGDQLFTPMVPPGHADLVIGLERLETLRAVSVMLRPGGTVIYYDSTYQPIHVRMGQAKYPTSAQLADAAAARSARLERVAMELPDARMQNVALLGRLAAIQAISGVDIEIVQEALNTVLSARAREANLAVFEKAATP